MGDVVNFQGRQGSRVALVPEQQVAAARSREERRERATELRTRLEANRPMSPGDQETVAHGVWRLLDQVQRSGAATKAQILRGVGIGSEGDSTKHLGQYASDPARSGAGPGRLNKRPRKYVHILDKAAELAGMDQNAVLLDVFNATSLSAPDAAQVAEPEFEELAVRLRAIGDWVASKHDLQTYFKKVRRSGLCLAVVNAEEDTKEQLLEPGEIEIAVHSPKFSLEWPVTFRERCDDFNRNDLQGQVPIYPSLIVGKVDVGDEYCFRYEPMTYDDEGLPLLTGAANLDAARIDGRYWAELRLCIVPSGPDLHPQTALRVAVGFYSSGPCSGPPEYEYLGPGFDIKGRLASTCPMAVTGTDGKEYRLWKDSPAAPGPIEKYFMNIHHSACIFLPLTGAVAQDWLSIPNHAFPEWEHEIPPHIRILGRCLLQPSFAKHFSPFVTDTIAAELDHCLSGLAQSDPLDLFDKQAGKFVELFNATEAKERDRRAKALSKLDNRLRRMPSWSPDPT